MQDLKGLIVHCERFQAFLQSWWTPQLCGNPPFWNLSAFCSAFFIARDVTVWTRREPEPYSLTCAQSKATRDGQTLDWIGQQSCVAASLISRLELQFLDALRTDMGAERMLSQELWMFSTIVIFLKCSGELLECLGAWLAAGLSSAPLKPFTSRASRDSRDDGVAPSSFH